MSKVIGCSLIVKDDFNNFLILQKKVKRTEPEKWCLITSKLKGKESYEKSINRGVRKINYYSYMGREGVIATRKYLQEFDNITFYHEIAFNAKEAMKKDVLRALKVFTDKIID